MLWIELIYFDGAAIQTYYGTIQNDLEIDVLSKSPDDWVMLGNPRFLNDGTFDVERFEDDMVGTAPYFYLRAKHIVRVATIRDDVKIWENVGVSRGRV